MSDVALRRKNSCCQTSWKIICSRHLDEHIGQRWPRNESQRNPPMFRSCGVLQATVQQVLELVTVL